MDYSIYKLKFTTGVHFGNGALNDSECVFHSDQLFSALYIEALKMGIADQWLKQVKDGKIIFSDALPFVQDQFLLPKPLLRIETENKGDSEEKKKYKKLKYVAMEQLDTYLKGGMDFSTNPEKSIGAIRHQVMANVRSGVEDTLPFHVGVFQFESQSGLYVMLRYETEEDKLLFEELMESLGYTGLGGKKSSGLGHFELMTAKMPAAFQGHLVGKKNWKMLISCALPTEQELDRALDGAFYTLEKRSGFVASTTYAEEERKKNDLYVFGTGSCFKNSFEGDIYDVSNGGKHPVYRLAKPFFLEI